MSNDGGDSRTFNRIAFITFALLVASTAGFCAIIDPYGLVGSPAIPGFTAAKSAAAIRIRFSKASVVQHVQPVTLITGSSVANIGINPDADGWSDTDRPVFNLGIDGATILLQKRFLLHALTVSHPRRVVIFTSFEDYAPAVASGASDTAGVPTLRISEDGKPDPLYWRGHLLDIAAATLSLRALYDSIATLVWQSGDLFRYQTAHGFEINGPEEQYAFLHGVRAAVVKTEQDIASSLLQWGPDPKPSLEPLADMIHAARTAGADVVVVIPPAHIEVIELRRQLGIAASVAAWRAGIARVVAAETSVALWDFGAPSPYNTVPPTDGIAMDDPHLYFWDAVHFTPALGALIVRRIENTDGPSDLGVRIDPASVDKWAQPNLAAQLAWAANHPDVVLAVEASVNAAKRKICSSPGAQCDRSGPPLLASSTSEIP